MDKLPFRAKVRIVTAALVKGKVAEIQYDLLRMLTLAYSREYPDRLREICAMLPDYAWEFKGRKCLSLESIQRCLREPSHDPRELIKDIGGFWTEQYKGLLRKQELAAVGQPIGTRGIGFPIGSGAYEVSMEISKLVERFGEWIKTCGSEAYARYFVETTEPWYSSEYYKRNAEYLMARFKTPPDESVSPPVPEKPVMRRWFRLDPDGIDPSWLVEPSMAEYSGMSLTVDDIESVYLDVAKMAADPRNGVARSKKPQRDRASDAVAKYRLYVLFEFVKRQRGYTWEKTINTVKPLLTYSREFEKFERHKLGSLMQIPKKNRNVPPGSVPKDDDWAREVCARIKLPLPDRRRSAV